MVAAGQVDVDRHVEREPRFDMRGDLSAWPLVSLAANLQPAIAGAGDQPGADARWPRSRGPSAAMRASTSATRASGTSEISRFCQTVRRMSPSPHWSRDRREPAHLLGRQPADRQHDADVAQPRLLLRVHADMRQAVGRRARRDVAGGDARERAAELLLDRLQELIEAPGDRARISAAPCCGWCGRRSR